MKTSDSHQQTHVSTSHSEQPFFGRALEQAFFAKERSRPEPFFKPAARSSPSIQAKLTVGAAGDQYEQEADRVASQVVDQINSPSVQQTENHPSVQRMGEEDELQAEPLADSIQRMGKDDLQRHESTHVVQQKQPPISPAPDIIQRMPGFLDYFNPRYILARIGGYNEEQMREYTNPSPSGLPAQFVIDFKRAFKVLPNGQRRTRPDQLYLNEYNVVAQLITDIYNGTTKIRISANLVDGITTNEDIKAEAIRDLIRIAQTRSGRTLLKRIARAAEAEPEVIVNAFDIVYTPSANPRDPKAPSNQPQKTDVYYTPSAYKTGLASNSKDNQDQLRQSKIKNPWVMPDRSDITLFHELVHAFHIQKGRAKEKSALVGQGTEEGVTVDPVDPIDAPYETQEGIDKGQLKGVSLEEYYTVGLGPYEKEWFTENRYRRERRSMGENVPARNYYGEKK